MHPLLCSEFDQLIFFQNMVIILWTITIFGILACIFDGFELLRKSDNAWYDGFYMGFNRSAWSFCTALLIFLCSTGYGGKYQRIIVNSLIIFSELMLLFFFIFYYLVDFKFDRIIKETVYSKVKFCQCVLCLEVSKLNNK